MNTENGTSREEFGSRSLTKTAEMQTAALTAQATASVNARYIMAMQRPRNWDDVRVRILRECERPGFAKAARYRKPIGRGVYGPSIRFAEACLRYAGNLEVDTIPIYEDRVRRTLKITATDFETNSSYAATLSLDKTVERRDSADRVVVGERSNSAGDKVYIVEATEDELLNKQNAAVSKAVRTLVLRLIPGDIVEEGQDKCVETMNKDAARDPAGEKKRICDAFAGIGVMPAALAAYLGHSLDAVQPAELVELREVYATIKDGEATWSAIMDAKHGPPPEKADAAKKTDNLADRVRARAAKKTPQPPPVAVSPPTNTAPDEPPGETREYDPETGEEIPPEES